MFNIKELLAKYGVGEPSEQEMMEKLKKQEQEWQLRAKEFVPMEPPANYSSEESAFIPREQMPYQIEEHPIYQPEEIKREPTQIRTSKEFEEKALPIFEKYDFPKAIGFGQYAGEGRVEDGGLGAQRNNFYNLNAVDSNPDQANSFTTPEEGIEAYVRFVTGQASDSFYANGVEQKEFLRQAFENYQETGDVEQYLRDIQDSGYASRKDYPEFVMSTPEWRNWLKG